MDFTNAVAIALNVVVVVIMLMYLLFSVIIVRQVSLMSTVIITGVDKYVKAFALLHLLFAFVVCLLIIDSLLI